MQSIKQIALDAGFTNDYIKGAQIALDELQATNPIGSQYGKDAYGIKLRADHQKFTDDIFLANDSREAKRIIDQMAQDSTTFSVPSSGVLSYFTTVFTNKIVEQIIQTTPFRELTHEFQQGEFGTTNIKIPTISFTGTAKPYSDHNGQGDSNINVNWIDRQAVTLERTITYGDLEVAQMAMAKIDDVMRKREGLAKLTNLDMNQIGFFGYQGMNIFGLTNDPGLNPVIVSPASIKNPASSQWIYKTFLEIFADVQSMVASVVAISGGQASWTDKFKLGLPPAVVTYLTDPNQLGTQSALEYIKGQFPGLELVQVQDYQGTGNPIGSVVPNIGQLIWDELGGQEVALNAFSSPYNSHGVIRMISSYQEKISYTVSGAIVTVPMGIATITGI